MGIKMRQRNIKLLFLFVPLLASCHDYRKAWVNNELSFDSSEIKTMLIDYQDRKTYLWMRCRTEDPTRINNRYLYYESFLHNPQKQTPDVSQYWRKTSVYFQTDKLTFDFKVYFMDSKTSYFLYNNVFYLTKDNLENFFEDYWEDNAYPEIKWTITKSQI